LVILVLLKVIDRGLLEVAGGYFLSKLFNNLSDISIKLQSGYIL
jgi:hypothetical protein